LCCLTWFCPCAVFGRTDHRLRKDSNLVGHELLGINTSCLLIWGAGCVCLHWLPLSIQRAKIREKYHLEGDCQTDIAAACCCGLCDLIQQEKETQYRRSATHPTVKQSYRPPDTMAYPAPAQELQQQEVLPLEGVPQQPQ